MASSLYVSSIFFLKFCISDIEKGEEEELTRPWGATESKANLSTRSGYVAAYCWARNEPLLLLC